MQIKIDLNSPTDAIESYETSESLSRSTTKNDVDTLLLNEIHDRQRRLKPGIWSKPIKASKS